jgi:hypothetical protein
MGGRNIFDYLKIASPFIGVGVLFLLSWLVSLKTKPTTKQHLLVKVVKWVARVIGLGETELLLFGVLAGWSFNPPSSSVEVILAPATVAIALAGCIVSWWRVRLAGILLIVTSFGVLINPLFIRPVVDGHFFILDYLMFASPLLVSGVLFLLSWWLSRKIGSSVHTEPP